MDHTVRKNWMKLLIPVLILCLSVKYSDFVIQVAVLLLKTLKPLLLGFVLAYMLNILMVKLEKLYFPKKKLRWAEKTRRPVCVLASILLVLCFIVVLVLLVLPALADSAYVLTKDIPKTYLKFQHWLSEVAAEAGYTDIQAFIDGLKINWNEFFGKLEGILTAGVGSVFSSAISVANVMVSFTVTGVVGLIFSVYILSSKEKLLGQFGKLIQAYLPGKRRETLIAFISLADDTFNSFITGQVLEAFILGFLCALGMAVLQMPYALMVGVIVGATALIPVMGCYVGAALGAFMIVTVSPAKALGFLVFLTILQQIEGNLIYPRVVGGSIGLPGIWVLAAVTIGGGLFGVAGMLIGVPLAATLYKWIRIDVNNRLES